MTSPTTRLSLLSRLWRRKKCDARFVQISEDREQKSGIPNSNRPAQRAMPIIRYHIFSSSQLPIFMACPAPRNSQLKFQITSTKLQINLKLQYSMTKTFTTVVSHGCTIPSSNLLRLPQACSDIASASAGTTNEFKIL